MKVIGNKILIVSFILASLYSCKDDDSTSPSKGTNVSGDPMAEMALSIVKDKQEQFIRSLQLKSGALTSFSNGTSINPYFDNYGILGLLTNPSASNIKVVKKYLDWYLGKLNGNVNPKTGAAEIEGSIYDYQISKDEEITSGTYDSVDSYAATFLIICEKLATCSPSDVGWLKERTAGINRVSSALIACIDTKDVKIPGAFTPDDDDFLSVASYNYDAKYLMDNAEVNRGIRAAEFLKKNGIVTNNIDYAYYADKNAKAIEAELWDGSSYRWMDSPSCKCNWNNFYADATAQLCPVMMGVLKPSDQRALSLWEKFNSIYGKWSGGYLYSDFPWVYVCFAAAAMQDEARVNEYVKYVYSYNSKGEQPRNWYSEEAGHLLIAIDLITNKSNF